MDIPFDDRANLAADVSDLDIGLMRQHLKEIGSSLYEISLKKDALKIAKAMGYKGITAKLSATVEKMLDTGALEKVMVGAYVKLHIPGDN